MNIFVYKSTDNAEPISSCFLPQYSTAKKIFISLLDQNNDTKKEQALSITFLQHDWFISQNGRSWLAITLRDKLTRAWCVQHCLDSYRQQQISQSDCEITSNCGKKKITIGIFFLLPVLFNVKCKCSHFLSLWLIFISFNDLKIIINYYYYLFSALYSITVVAPQFFRSHTEHHQYCYFKWTCISIRVVTFALDNPKPRWNGTRVNFKMQLAILGTDLSIALSEQYHVIVKPRIQ